LSSKDKFKITTALQTTAMKVAWFSLRCLPRVGCDDVRLCRLFL